MMSQVLVLASLLCVISTVAAQGILPPILHTCDATTETDCGLLDVNLQCEYKCNDTSLCINACIGGAVGGIIGGLTGQCVCKAGYYRDKKGICVSIDVCLAENLSVDCSRGNERQVNCSVLDLNLKCEYNCNNTAVCANVCTNLLSGTLNGVTGVLGGLLGPVNGLAGGVLGGVGGVAGGVLGGASGLSFHLGPLTACACNQGFFRGQNGLCVSQDACVSGTGIISG